MPLTVKNLVCIFSTICAIYLCKAPSWREKQCGCGATQRFSGYSYKLSLVPFLQYYTILYTCVAILFENIYWSAYSSYSKLYYACAYLPANMQELVTMTCPFVGK